MFGNSLRLLYKSLLSSVVQTETRVSSLVGSKIYIEIYIGRFCDIPFWKNLVLIPYFDFFGVK